MMTEFQDLYNKYHPLVDNGLMIIADISGFTNYINVTEIEHSQKIIAKLLESLIDANELGLFISEIEGDAVFFFKFGTDDSYSALINQIKRMTQIFYSTLEGMSTDKTCECGACSVLAGLNIKFIVHIGKIGTIMIKNFCKFYGIDVIVVHRLLKNHLKIIDYALFTSKVVRKLSNEKENNFSFSSGFIMDEDAYEDIGVIKYTYISLKKFLEK